MREHVSRSVTRFQARDDLVSCDLIAGRSRVRIPPYLAVQNIEGSTLFGRPQKSPTLRERSVNVRCLLDRRRWRTDLRLVTTVSRSDAPVYTHASFAVESGRPGAQPA
jgi:hypothetical protein